MEREGGREIFGERIFSGFLIVNKLFKSLVASLSYSRLDLRRF